MTTDDGYQQEETHIPQAMKDFHDDRGGMHDETQPAGLVLYNTL